MYLGNISEKLPEQWVRARVSESEPRIWEENSDWNNGADGFSY